MGRYVLREDLSFCHVGGCLVFFDIGSDQYLRLPSTLGAALVKYLSSESPSHINVDELVARNILVEQGDSAPASRPTAIPPTRSSMEEAHPLPRVSFLQALEALALVVHTQMTLKLRPFKHVLRIAGAPAQTFEAPPLEQQVIKEAAAFRRSRLYIPVEMRCLVDSIALARFLRRRKRNVHVVFGVAVDPFSAHCWVQAGDLVLNDTLGNVTSHTPIRVA
ncbi:lasso peptide biosynthesis B2 protein [Luteimonas sp. JM171]|uniref:lasso peptide biosynthesis B2 protein n=1 Tax=Luteimonas sp. JM171 TaxID=1896164 RepID=UPI0008577103|nr:lasso peptide biosynthesis B2 protein [Luteimonas sp. JM171]AOH37236.1 hypothetical protein BGP89_13500 [Luteimonas sp. JM171]